MSSDQHTYRVIEVVGSSASSLDDAIRNGIERVSKTVRDLRWFEVIGTRGHVEAGKVQHFQVTLKVGFTVEEV